MPSHKANVKIVPQKRSRCLAVRRLLAYHQCFPRKLQSRSSVARATSARRPTRVFQSPSKLDRVDQ